MIEITWHGIELTVELDYEPADPQVGYMDETWAIEGVRVGDEEDLMEYLTEKAIDEILQLAITEAKEYREESRAMAQESSIEAREHALAERQMRRMGV